MAYPNANFGGLLCAAENVSSKLCLGYVSEHFLEIG